jgi:DUF4097 and DUF4098 domain-containing protein YvlB
VTKAVDASKTAANARHILIIGKHFEKRGVGGKSTAQLQTNSGSRDSYPLMKTLIAAFAALVAASPAYAQFPLDSVLSARPGGKLTLNIEPGGSIQVKAADDNRLRVHIEERRECEPACRVDFDNDDGSVRIRAYNSGHPRRTKGELRFRIEVPKNYDLDLHTTGGSVSIDGVNGDIKGRTMGGGLEFANLSGRMDFSTMGGGVRVSDSELDGRVSTMGGNVTLDNVRGDLRGSTMGGNVTQRGDARAMSSSASRSVSSSGNRSRSSGVVRMRTMGGPIDVDDADEGADVETMGGNIHIGRAGADVRAMTMGGSITLDEVDGAINATTLGGDVTAKMVGDASRGDRDIHISSLHGDIDVTVPKDLSMDVKIELEYTRGHEGEYKVTTDFPVNQSVTDEWDRSHGDPRKTVTVTGKVGGANNTVRIHTINGNVRIFRR